MSRATLLIATAALIVGGTPASAQVSPPEMPADQQVKKLPRQNLSGPRFGFTTFTGETADLRDMADLEPIMSQFGWQFETQIVSMTGGAKALMEVLVLAGGVEQDDLTLTTVGLAGYRLPNGVEFGAGPSLSWNKTSEDTTTSMVVAAGATLPFGDLYVPLNAAVAFAEGGPRITTLIGWIIG